MKSSHPFLDITNQISNDIKELRLMLSNSGDNKFLFFKHEFITLMGISGKTEKNWRAQGIIEYSKVGSKIYYSKKNIKKFLDNHEVKKK